MTTILTRAWKSRPLRAPALVAVSAFVAFGTSAWMNHSGGSLHGCVSTGTGDVRLTDSGDCASNEFSLRFEEVPAPSGGNGIVATASRGGTASRIQRPYEPRSEN
jgi:hypothetical protein